MGKYASRVLCGRRRSDVVQTKSSFRCSILLSRFLRGAKSCRQLEYTPVLPFRTTFVKNTPDTIPQTEELESLRAELVEVHLHSLEMEVPREEKGKVKAVESEKGVSVFIDGCTVGGVGACYQLPLAASFFRPQ
jgi:hypothetical protein